MRLQQQDISTENINLMFIHIMPENFLEISHRAKCKSYTYKISRKK